MKTEGIKLDLPDAPGTLFTDLVLDYTGTLSRDGVLLDGVAGRLTQLAARMRVTVMTADTFGTAVEQLAGLPVTVAVIRDGQEKAARVRAIGGDRVVAIGNGRNDVPMMVEAGLRMAVVGFEGAAADLLRSVDVVVCSACDALDLLLQPFRLKATLRD